MATKIKNILDIAPHEGLLFSSWLAQKGIDRKEQSMYVKSGWLERVTHGVYKFVGAEPTLYKSVSSYNSQLEKSCHVGASSALDLRGYSHFVAMGKPNAYLFTDKQHRLPQWLVKREWDMVVKYFTTSIFKDDMGLELHKQADNELLISSPERAVMECTHLAPEYFSLMDVYYIMEMLTTLRPALVQFLLEKCTSIKVKRIFLYMAKKANHLWFKQLDPSKIDLGSEKYQITIPKELRDYE